ncbi:MAG TPA: N-methyl-L-tryptophan oxidase, partial [Dehalococcoidia bacterium]|nr:N-methyl-L-tryptophan oxidase [Dehalococcoidia bacterium]
ENVEVIVVGLGAAGSATLQQLARRGIRPLGIDRFSPPHDRGSSHGDTRVTRQAIGEGAAYMPLVRRSHEIWRGLEAEHDVQLLRCNGCLVIQDPGPTSVHGAPDFLGTTVAAAKQFGVPVELLDATETMRRFPQFSLRGDEHACFEPSGGYVLPERCVATQLDDAMRHGALVRRNERVLRIAADGSGVAVDTDAQSYRAARCVLSAGAWVMQFLPQSWRNTFRVYPQVLTWFAAEPGSATDHGDTSMPSFVWAIRGGDILYGVPAVPGSPEVKVATEQFAETCEADTVRESFDAAGVAGHCNHLMRPRFPGLRPDAARSTLCMYTVTPDMGFVVDSHPDVDSVIVVSACSGHGFKHSAGLGAAVAELIESGAAYTDLAPFSMSRFGA